MQAQMTGTYEPLAERGRAFGRHEQPLERRARDVLERRARRAKGLGWLSIALGLPQIIAPRGVMALIGASRDRGMHATALLVGIRELAVGIGLLARPRSSGLLWARVAGDVMDLALLGRSLQARRREEGRLMKSLATVAAVLVVDGLAALQMGRATRGTARRTMREGIHVVKAITVNRTPEEVYAFWRDFQNLPRFMAHLESVKVTNGRSHWRAKAPAGFTVEWDAEITTDRPSELLAWRSVEGSTVSHSGTVRFAAAPGGRGTEIHVDLRYRAPGGRIGAAIAKLFGEEPSQQIEGDLRRFKQVIETGDVVRSDASIHHGMHPARPSKHMTKEIFR